MYLIVKVKELVTMFKKNIILLILVLVISCEKKTTETRYYPTERLFSKQTSSIIELDNTKLNFRQITNKIGTYINNDENLVVEFNDGNIKKRVIPFRYSGGLIKGKNILRIKSDSILIDNKYPTADLKKLLRRHHLNKGKIANYSDSRKKAIVEITIDTNKTGKELKQVLTKLTRSFDEIKEEIDDTIELKIFFDYFRQIPPPPLPPQPKTK